MKLLNMQCFLILLLSLSVSYSEPKYSKHCLLFCLLFIKRYHLWITP